MGDLLAEDFALLSLEPPMGVPSSIVLPTMSRRLSGLLLIELAIDELIVERGHTLVVAQSTCGDSLLDSHLAAVESTLGPVAAQVEAALASNPGVWNTILTRLLDDGVVAFRRADRSRHSTGLDIVDSMRRDRLIALVRHAARSSDELDARVAALLASSGMWPMPVDLRQRFETGSSIVRTVEGHSVIHPLGPAFDRARAAQREPSLCPAARSILAALAAKVSRGTSAG